jgi:tRNA nucleotidyltransferase (CCA-adding enzyme)
MPNLAQLLTTKSSAEFQHVFNTCREIARKFDEIDGVYVVGGVVRDLILDRKPGDIDLSVVGDARLFAEALANRLGFSPPVESQFLTYKISTSGASSNVSGDIEAIDVVNSRTETYAGPAALPDITPSSIEDDLKRRDFTINSMAISLSDSDWGTLVDPMNGFGDIMRKRIKVHHDESYVLDPTRIYRTVRYATRLGFTIDPRTVELISVSLQNIERLSGARIRHEFELILSEEGRVEMLRVCEELGLLAAISPGLRVGSKALQVLESQSGDGTISTDMNDLLAITTFGMNEDEAAQTIARFDGPPVWGESITGNAKLATFVAVLDDAQIQRSEVAELLKPIPLASIRAYIAAGPPLPRRDRLTEYIDEIRFVKPDINGDDLIAIGIPQGPIIGQLIDIVRRARLDGQVSSKEEELELAKSRLPGFLTD